jgi:hypothetical protein
MRSVLSRSCQSAASGPKVSLEEYCAMIDSSNILAPRIYPEESGPSTEIRESCFGGSNAL